MDGSCLIITDIPLAEPLYENVQLMIDGVSRNDGFDIFAQSYDPMVSCIAIYDLEPGHHDISLQFLYDYMDDSEQWSTHSVKILDHGDALSCYVEEVWGAPEIEAVQTGANQIKVTVSGPARSYMLQMTYSVPSGDGFVTKKVAGNSTTTLSVPTKRSDNYITVAAAAIGDYYEGGSYSGLSMELADWAWTKVTKLSASQKPDEEQRLTLSFNTDLSKLSDSYYVQYSVAVDGDFLLTANLDAGISGMQTIDLPWEYTDALSHKITVTPMLRDASLEGEEGIRAAGTTASVSYNNKNFIQALWALKPTVKTSVLGTTAVIDGKSMSYVEVTATYSDLQMDTDDLRACLWYGNDIVFANMIGEEYHNTPAITPGVVSAIRSGNSIVYVL